MRVLEDHLEKRGAHLYHKLGHWWQPQAHLVPQDRGSRRRLDGHGWGFQGAFAEGNEFQGEIKPFAERVSNRGDGQAPIAILDFLFWMPGLMLPRSR